MKTFGIWLGILLAASGTLCAQVTVDVALDQDQFLPGEALVAAVRITNRSGQTLLFGREANWLTFSVESMEGSIVLKTGEVPVLGEFTLESSKRAIKRVDLAPCFTLRRPGRYKIIATVNIKEWNRQITSPPKPLDIVEGTDLWSQDVGVPPPAGVTNQPPEIRHYALQQANYLRRLMLYFRLNDRTGKLNKVYPLGPMISFGQPEAQVDKSSNMHVLYQTGPRLFSYIAINPEGNLIVRQSYEFTSRPHLHASPDGAITVLGGARRMMSTDVPPATTVQNDASKPTP